MWEEYKQDFSGFVWLNKAGDLLGFVADLGGVAVIRGSLEEEEKALQFTKNYIIPSCESTVCVPIQYKLLKDVRSQKGRGVSWRGRYDALDGEKTTWGSVVCKLEPVHSVEIGFLLDE